MSGSRNKRKVRIIISISLLLLGLLFITVPAYFNLGKTANSIFSQLAGVIIVSTILNFLIEEYKMENLKDRIEGITYLADDIRSTGLKGIPQNLDFAHEINWQKYFKEVRNLDIFVSYANTWRNNHIKEFRTLANRKDANVNIILPNFKKNKILHELSRRYNYDPNGDKVRNKIKTAIEAYNAIFMNKKTEAKYNLFLTEITPVYSSYRFDHIGIIATYKHITERGGVPTLIFEEGGSLYSFLNKDLVFLKENSILHATNQ